MSELFEEYLEQLIALGMASLFTLLVTKVVSAIFVITLTQTTKLAIKSIFLQIIKKIMKKEKAREIMNKFLEFINTNKWTLLVGAFVAVVGGYCGFSVCETYFTLALWLDALIGVVVGLVIFALVFLVGKDTAWALTLRMANKVLSKDKYEKICNLYSELEALQISENAEADIAKQQEKEQAKKLAKAQKLLAKEQAQAEAKQKKEQENAEIIALAEKLKAEQEAQTKNETTQDTNL